MKVDIFVSYSSKETNVTEYVCDKLEKAGLKCWVAHRDIPVGSDYAEQIPDAIANCKVFLLLMSDHAQKSKYVLREVNEAVDREKVIIPFFIRKTDLAINYQFFLKRYQHIEGFTNQSSDNFGHSTKDFGLRNEAIEQLIKQIKKYLGYPLEEPAAKKTVEQPAPQPPVIIQTEAPKRYTRRKRLIVCPNCSDGNLKIANYVPEMFAAELDNRPVALSVTSGFGISFFYLLAYSWLDGKTVAAPAADTTPVVETIPITETIANGEKTAEIGGKVLETLGGFFGVILIILRFLLPFLLIVGIVTFVIYLFLRMYKEHFAMIKKSRMRIWSFQCCSCMHKFTIITRASDNLSERVPNLVKKPRRKTSTSLYRY